MTSAGNHAEMKKMPGLIRVWSMPLLGVVIFMIV
jgi:hypothetical protein